MIDDANKQCTLTCSAAEMIFRDVGGITNKKEDKKNFQSGSSLNEEKRLFERDYEDRTRWPHSSTYPRILHSTYSVSVFVCVCVCVCVCFL